MTPNYMILHIFACVGYVKECPAVLELPAGARIRKTHTKIRKK